MKIVLSYEEIRDALKHYLKSRGLDLQDIRVEFLTRDCEAEYPTSVENAVVEEVKK